MKSHKSNTIALCVLFVFAFSASILKVINIEHIRNSAPVDIVAPNHESRKDAENAETLRPQRNHVLIKLQIKDSSSLYLSRINQPATFLTCFRFHTTTLPPRVNLFHPI